MRIQYRDGDREKVLESLEVLPEGTFLGDLEGIMLMASLASDGTTSITSVTATEDIHHREAKPGIRVPDGARDVILNEEGQLLFTYEGCRYKYAN